jgi:hypothetical protein
VGNEAGFKTRERLRKPKKSEFTAAKEKMPIQDSNQGIQKAEMNQNLIC